MVEKILSGSGSPLCGESAAGGKRSRKNNGKRFVSVYDFGCPVLRLPVASSLSCMGAGEDRTSGTDHDGRPESCILGTVCGSCSDIHFLAAAFPASGLLCDDWDRISDPVYAPGRGGHPASAVFRNLTDLLCLKAAGYRPADRDAAYLVDSGGKSCRAPVRLPSGL